MSKFNFNIDNITNDISLHKLEKPRNMSQRQAYENAPVDLGLPSGILWAKYNLGVDTSKQNKTANDYFGNYYAFGEIDPKDEYTWENYKHAHGSGVDLTKYCYNVNYAYDECSDGLMILEKEDDAAYLILGEHWKTPSLKDVKELIENVKSSYVKDYNDICGLNGYVLTGKTNESIFIPKAGRICDDELIGVGEECFLMTTSVSGFYPDNVVCLHASMISKIDIYHIDRNQGLTIRPIYKEK